MGNLEPQVRNCSNLFPRLNKRLSKSHGLWSTKEFWSSQSRHVASADLFPLPEKQGLSVGKAAVSVLSLGTAAVSIHQTRFTLSIWFSLVTFIKMFGSQPLTLVKKDCWSTIGGNLKSTAVIFFPYYFAALFMLLCLIYEYSWDLFKENDMLWNIYSAWEAEKI